MTMSWMHKARKFFTKKSQDFANGDLQHQPINWNYTDIDEEDAGDNEKTVQDTCQTCHHLRLRVNSVDFFHLPQKEYETNIADFKKAARRRRYSTARSYGKSILKFSSEEGWPRGSKNVKM